MKVYTEVIQICWSVWFNNKNEDLCVFASQKWKLGARLCRNIISGTISITNFDIQSLRNDMQWMYTSGGPNLQVPSYFEYPKCYRYHLALKKHNFCMNGQSKMKSLNENWYVYDWLLKPMSLSLSKECNKQVKLPVLRIEDDYSMTGYKMNQSGIESVHWGHSNMLKCLV